MRNRRYTWIYSAVEQLEVFSFWYIRIGCGGFFLILPCFFVLYHFCSHMTALLNGILNEQFYIRTVDLTISWLLLLLLVLLVRQAETYVCKLIVGVDLCEQKKNNEIRKHWRRRYVKLDAIVYTKQIDLHVFCLFMAIPYWHLKSPKQFQILYKWQRQ